VRRVGPRAPASSESLAFPDIAHSCSSNRLLELTASKLRMPPRTGVRTHVDQARDRPMLQKAEELRPGPISMANRVDGKRLHYVHGARSAPMGAHADGCNRTAWPKLMFRSDAALAWFAAISMRPMLFSYQKATPVGTSENTRALSRVRAAIVTREA
jgi:hypothetical protein